MVVPSEYALVVLGKDEHAMMVSSWEVDYAWLVHKVVEECMEAMRSAMVGAREEEEGEEEGSSTRELVPAAKQAPKPQVTLPVEPEFWATGPSGQVMGHRLACI